MWKIEGRKNFLNYSRDTLKAKRIKYKKLHYGFLDKKANKGEKLRRKWTKHHLWN